MWVFTSFGILMPALRPKGTVAPGDPRTIQVRARREKDLRILRDEYMGDTLSPTIRMAGTDYQVRAYCTPEAWANALGAIAMDIDYASFKDTTESKYHDKQLHDVCYRVWHAIFTGLSDVRHRNWYTRGLAGHVTVPSSTGRRVSDLVGTAAYDDDLDGTYTKIEVIRDSAGRIDHAYCDHGQSKNAKRRCLRANRQS